MDLCNKYILKLSNLSLYCFSYDLSLLATKLDAKYMLIPCLPNELLRITALFYFDSHKHIIDTFNIKNPVFY